MTTDHPRAIEDDISTASISRWTNEVHDYDLPHLRIRQVAALVGRLGSKTLIDLGCAAGLLRTLCTDTEYIGCDFVSPDPQRGFTFYPCDFNRQPLPAELGTADVIVCSGLLEYIEDIPSFLEQVRAHINPGGHLVATYFNMNHISRIWALIRGESLYVHPDWRGLYSPRDFGNLLSNAGLHPVIRHAMNHSFRVAVGVEQTVKMPMILKSARPWSPLLAHQLIYVARHV